LAVSRLFMQRKEHKI